MNDIPFNSCKLGGLQLKSPNESFTLSRWYHGSGASVVPYILLISSNEEDLARERLIGRGKKDLLVENDLIDSPKMDRAATFRPGDLWLIRVSLDFHLSRELDRYSLRSVCVCVSMRIFFNDFKSISRFDFTRTRFGYVLAVLIRNINISSLKREEKICYVKVITNRLGFIHMDFCSIFFDLNLLGSYEAGRFIGFFFSKVNILRRRMCSGINYISKVFLLI